MTSVSDLALCASTHRERERKYIWPADGGPGRAAPANLSADADLELVGAAGVGTVREREAYRLDATYYDTADLRLAEHHVTLRRRVGDDDPGWHLKVPLAAHDRLEVQLRDDRQSEEVPAQLVDAVGALRLGEPLVAVADITSIRREQHLIDPDGVELAVVAHDQVRSTRRSAPTSEVDWSELEVELTDGDQSDLRTTDALLLDRGLVPAPWWSKLAHTLAEEAEPVRSSDATRDPVVDPIGSYLATQWHVWVINDIGLRTGQVDSVHDLRVALRRIRATLATFRPMLDTTRSEALRDALKPLGACLGRLRDNEVLTSTLLEALAGVPPEQQLGPVQDRISHDLGIERAEAQQAVDRLLDGDAYLDALAMLRGLLAERAQAQVGTPRPAKLDTRVQKAARRVKKADQSMRRSDDADESTRDRGLHQIRKAAKRSRYAFEATEAILGKSARRGAARMEVIQEVLGDQHDTVSARDALRAMAARTGAHGENGFTFGLLYSRQEIESERALASYVKARHQAF